MFLSFAKLETGKSTLLNSLESFNFLTKETRASRESDTPPIMISVDEALVDVYDISLTLIDEVLFEIMTFIRLVTFRYCKELFKTFSLSFVPTITAESEADVVEETD